MPKPRSAELLALQTEVLECVATGETLPDTASLLCLRAEALAPGAICTLLLVDEDQQLRPLAGPSVPPAYSRAIDGLPIGPAVGSCGTAAFANRTVVVTDIAADPLWAEFKDLALSFGLAACWSTPIVSRAGRVIGTFAFYYGTSRGPTELERTIVDVCVRLAAIAIEHDQVTSRNEQLARCDSLTGLSNRGSFDRTLGRLAQARDSGFALLLMDIDRLKSFNDTMGHSAGDALIQHVARRLSLVQGKHEVFRIGGDEFAALLEDCPTPQSVRNRARAFIDALKEPLVWNGQTVVSRLTIGGALFGADGQDAESLRQNADFALYHAKETRRGDYVRFHTGLRRKVTDRIAAITIVGDALERDQIVAHYQPIVRLETAEIVGVEALARVRLSDGSIVSAGSFGPALEDPTVGYQLTSVMFTQAAAAVRAWLDDGIPFQHVGINVASCDFLRGDLDSRLVKAFAKAGVPLSHVVLEVTESVLLDDIDTSVARMVSALRRGGAMVALDDFGTGFASLSHLMSLPVDVIKIDRSFVDRILHDQPSAVIVEALVDIARKLNIRVVAEGIETAEQAERLVSLGCRLGQGYHFAPPVDFTAMTQLLKSFAQGTRAAKAERVHRPAANMQP